MTLLKLRPQLTATAWRIGRENLRLLIVAMYFIWLALATTAYGLFDQPFLTTLVVTFFILLGFSLVLFFADWLHGLANRGKLLLDCGPSPVKNMLLLQSGIWFALGIYIGRSLKSDLGSLAANAFGATFAAYCLILAIGRFQIRENGIWRYASLLQWKRINSYRLSEDSTLLINAKGLGGVMETAIQIHPQFSHMVVNCLDQRTFQAIVVTDESAAR